MASLLIKTYSSEQKLKINPIFLHARLNIVTGRSSEAYARETQGSESVLAAVTAAIPHHRQIHPRLVNLAARLFQCDPASAAVSGILVTDASKHLTADAFV